MNADTDAQLVSRAQAGNREAFLTLYSRYLNRVFNRVKARVPAQDVEDVVQEIFIAALRSLRGFEQHSQFSTWLYTIVNRKIADFYRKRQRTIGDDHLVSLDEIEHTVSAWEYGREQMDEHILLKRALDQLPEHYREVIFLRLIDQYPFAEIAEKRGQSIDAVKSLYRRAIHAIYEQLNDAEYIR